MIFSLGDAEKAKIEIDVLRYERAPIGEFYDDNWLTIKIYVSAGGLRGSVAAAFLTSELEKFAAELQSLFQTLEGIAEFQTLEKQLHLKLKGDGKGHVALNGELLDQAGIGNRLNFSFQFDQVALGESIREIKAVTAKFPVRSTWQVGSQDGAKQSEEWRHRCQEGGPS
jgi:hypothetical protein